MTPMCFLWVSPFLFFSVFGFVFCGSDAVDAEILSLVGSECVCLFLGVGSVLLLVFLQTVYNFLLGFRLRLKCLGEVDI